MFFSLHIDFKENTCKRMIYSKRVNFTQKTRKQRKYLSDMYDKYNNNKLINSNVNVEKISFFYIKDNKQLTFIWKCENIFCIAKNKCTKDVQQSAVLAIILSF